MSTKTKGDFEMQAIPTEDTQVYIVKNEQPSSSSISLFSKVALVAGVMNMLFLGMLVSEVGKLVPAAVFVSDHQRELSSFLSITSSISDASVRLMHGSIPQLVNDLLTSDISGAALDTELFAASVHSATCTASIDKNDYADFANFYISQYSSLVHSISNQIANINSLTPSNDDTDDTATPQLTGKGGIIFEPLKYAIDFIKAQTDPLQWKAASCSCRSLAEQLKSDMTFTDYYGADCGGSSLRWDVQSSALQYLNSISTTCSSLCDKLSAE